MKFNEAIEHILNEDMAAYKSFKSVDNDNENVSETVKQIIKDKKLYDIMDKDINSVRVYVGKDIKRTASIPKSGSIRGRRHSGKMSNVINIVFYDSFWKKDRVAESFWTVKDFNNWLNINGK
jgi:hypothetical protein